MKLQTIYRIGAVISLVTALAVWLNFGLPQKSDFIGESVEGIGYVAPDINAIAPPFTKQTLDNRSLDLLSLRGETVVLNFWATWCVPCAIEMPELQALHKETGVRIIGVNLGEPQRDIIAWVERFDLTFDIVLDPSQDVSKAYRLRGQPSTYVINPDGIITHIFYGAVNQDALQRAIRTHDGTAS